jgi:hypothetical protein
MYDALTSSYSFACPNRGETNVRFSAFRRLERLPGARHPAVYRVHFQCPCGDEHPGLIAHDELDWAPLGMGEGLFLNLMTARLEPIEAEFEDLAVRHIQAGEWPWSFFCYPEERPRPVFPSSFSLLAPGSLFGSVGIAVRCPSCARVSVNLVSSGHVDLPFVNDPRIGVIEHIFPDDAAASVDDFRAALYSGEFDARRLLLE